MSWYIFDDGKTTGQLGSENGTILLDEEHAEGARITLEKDGQVAPFSITCGIYGWMMHTRFFSSEKVAQHECEEMKEALSQILSAIPLAVEYDSARKSRATSLAIAEFVERFP